MKSPLDELIKRLKSAGHSATEPRLRVFSAMQAVDTQTMRQLITSCADVDRSTIYRTIELFEELGVVHRIPLGWKYQLELSDEFVHHHHHFSCDGCGVISVFAEDKALENRLIALAEAAKFKPSGHNLEIHGLCRHCREAAKA